MPRIVNPVYGFQLTEEGDALVEVHGETGESVTIVFSDAEALYSAAYLLQEVGDMVAHLHEFGFDSTTERWDLPIESEDDSAELWAELERYEHGV